MHTTIKTDPDQGARSILSFMHMVKFAQNFIEMQDRLIDFLDHLLDSTQIRSPVVKFDQKNLAR